MKYLLAVAFTLFAHNARALTVNVEVLRPWQIKVLNGPQQLAYYTAIQNIINQLESQIGDKPHHAFLRSFVLPNAFAESRTGDSCEAGGYFSLWVRDGNGALVCVPQNDDPKSGLAVNESFYCDGASQTKAFCNEGVYLYGSNSGQRFCEPTQNLSANCAKDFEKRYGRAGDSDFPNRLLMDGKRYSMSMSPAEHEQNAANFESSVNALLKDNQIDPKTADEIKKSLGVVAASKNIVALDAEAKLAAQNREESPSAAGAAPGSAQEAPIGYSTGGSAPGGASAPASTAPSQIAPAAPAGNPGGGSGGAPAALGAVGGGASPAPSKLLGRELTCVRDGLSKMGYAPSERYLALLGVGAQAASGAYDTNQEMARGSMQARVISMVQAYGFCDEKSYPAKKLKTADVALVRRWLTADGGKAQPRHGVEYYRQMMDPTSQALAARSFYDIFGLRKATARGADPRAFDQSVEQGFGQLFSPTEGNWAKESLAQRQAHANAINGLDPRGDFSECNKNAQALRKNDGAFHLGDLGGRGARRSVARQLAATNGLCASMASSCQLNVGNVCQGPAGSPAITPPAAPAGTGVKIK